MYGVILIVGLRVNNIPTMHFLLEFSEILSQNHICYHSLSVSGISKIMHCGILINMPYFNENGSGLV